jgi:hypothetical protein
MTSPGFNPAWSPGVPSFTVSITAAPGGTISICMPSHSIVAGGAVAGGAAEGTNAPPGDVGVGDGVVGVGDLEAEDVEAAEPEEPGSLVTP